MILPCLTAMEDSEWGQQYFRGLVKIVQHENMKGDYYPKYII